MLSFYLSMLETDEERKKMEEIYEEYKDLMARVASKYSSTQEDIEDAVHDSFVEIIKHKDTIFSKTRSEVRRYIMNTVKNERIDLHRKESHHEEVPLDDYRNTMSDDDFVMDEIVIGKERYDLVRSALKEIDETSRVILEMKYTLDFSYAEIAKRLNIKVKYVETRLKRAKDRLRFALERRDKSETGSHV
jgi:RNA polymerase sigma-70 factor (ECF subfamily)